jgi:large subunit ribosomal protein L15
VNLGQLQQALDAGKLTAEGGLDARKLVAAHVLRRPGDGIRLLAKGTISAAITIEVAGASEAAVAAVEAAGGKVVILGRPAAAEPVAEQEQPKRRGRREAKPEAPPPA